MQARSQKGVGLTRVKLIVGAIGKDKRVFAQAKDELCEEFGECDYESEELPFDKTDYYYPELGKPLKRKFYSFKRPISQDRISTIKLTTRKIEDRFRNKYNKKRRINLDPGYLSKSKLVLATTKDFAHRIYLRQGIFAEVTLHYVKGSFRPYRWTFPDYRTQRYIEIFNKIRREL